MELYGFDVSKLTNLKSVVLQGGYLDTLQCAAFHCILFTLNAPGLRRITLIFPHDNCFLNVKELDECLAERFINMELLTVECYGLQEEELECAWREIQDMFPQVAHRGMLQVQIYEAPFRY